MISIVIKLVRLILIILISSSVKLFTGNIYFLYILGETPPELSADIIDKGIVLTGGGALVDGFSQVLSQELKVPVFTAESPLTCVAEGTGILLDNLYMLERQ